MEKVRGSEPQRELIFGNKIRLAIQTIRDKRTTRKLRHEQERLEATPRVRAYDPESRFGAENFCHAIVVAAEKTQHAHALVEEADRFATGVIHDSMFGSLPFKLAIKPWPKVESYVVQDDNIIENDPESFVASEVRSVSRHGVEFYDRDSDKWLRIRGYQFDVKPLYPEPDPPTAA